MVALCEVEARPGVDAALAYKAVGKKGLGCRV
jgi:hypothetical protein